MRDIIIDEEFKMLLPALDRDTYAWLEDNIITYGCREPLVLWGDVLIDGHNRYEILMKHGLEFETVSLEFDSREAVIIWIISTQVSRRNLNPMQLSYYRGLHYNTEKKVQGSRNQNVKKSEKPHSDVFQGPTSGRLAELYKVSKATIERDSRIADALVAIGKVSPEVKKGILSGDTRISRKQLRELSRGAEAEVAAVTESIKDGEFERGKPKVLRPVSQPVPVFLEPEMIISKMIEDFYYELQSYTAGEAVGLKEALRMAIERLEGFYRLVA